MTTYIKRFAVNKQPVKDPNGGWINYTDVCIDTNPRFEHLLTSHDIVILEQAAEIARLREALKPFVMAYTENGGCVPVTEDDREEMLYSIFNIISLDDFNRATRALRGE